MTSEAERVALETVLTVKELTKSFGSLKAVDNVSLELPKGKIALLMGPNGSGKTTLLNCISGVYKPDGGQVIYKGTDITGKPPHEIADMGCVRTFQIPLPFLSLTVLENLLVSHRGNPGEGIARCLLKGTWFDEEKDAVENASRVLKLLVLEHLGDSPASSLSGGQLKLLEVGRALMTEAETILMDEPAGSVNPMLAHEIFSHIKGLRDRLGLSFLIVEHRLDIATEYIDEICAMANGRVLCRGLPHEVFSHPEVIESYLGE